MIYDPENVKIAMDDHGILFEPCVWGKDEQGNPVPVEWKPIVEVKRDGTFRRPEW